MRRLILTASVAVACATMAQPVDAQFQFGVQGAYMTGLEEIQAGGDLNGTMGVGGRVQFSPPIPTLSIGVVGQGVYYFPDCGGVDCKYMTYGIGAKLGLALPMVSPYVIGGWQWRKSEVGTFSGTENGATAGVGVALGMIPVFVEATMEFNEEDPLDPDFDVNPLVIQAGVLIGG
jgi:opacity protein-like surface antigen